MLIQKGSVFISISIVVVALIILIFVLPNQKEGKEMDKDMKMDEKTENYSTATFAGGCFWCMEPPFEKKEGVFEVISGYTGGETENPSYEEVSGGKTGHVEAIRIRYDENKISYPELLDIFWMNIDPTDPGGQFVDRGGQYVSAIFYHNEEQKTLAEASKKELESSGKFDEPIATEILQAVTFYPASFLLQRNLFIIKHISILPIPFLFKVFFWDKP